MIDVVSKTFWRTNEHFADLFNAVLFGGRQVVNPDCLEEMDTDVSGVIMSDDYKMSLKDMMADMPVEFADMFVDYHINLVQILDSDRLLFHNDDVRILFDVVSSIYKRDFEHIFKKYKDNKISNELNWMIGKLTGRSNIPDIVEGKEGDVVDMCKAWEERDRQMEEKGYIKASIEAIIFMIKYGMPKEIILEKYSESDYNEALAKLESEK